MKVLQAGLNQQTPVTVYDKTKPYLAGRVFSKTIGGLQVYGPPLTGFTNTLSDTGSGLLMTYTTNNGRMFKILTVSVGIATLALYTVDQTGQSAPTYIGKILVRLPNAAATTHTARGFQVYDGPNPATLTGWQIMIGTVGSVLINGGLFIVNNVGYADFQPTSPPTIEMAVASNAKAVYMAQDPGAIGVNNTLTAMQAMSMDKATRRIYFHNNVLATTQWAVFDPSATPNLVLQTTTAPTVSGTPTFTLASHGYLANDPVIITANAPTSFTASNAVSAQTVYFVRNPLANTFELSATTGGASINATSNTSATVVTRAFGQSVSQWLNLRTGIITGIAGTVLLTNSEQIITPSQSIDPNIPISVSGQVCLFFCTSTGFYLAKVSEITNGALNFPSMVTVNVAGTLTDYTAITNSFGVYSEVTGRIIYVSNGTQLYVKRWLNSVIDTEFGALNTTWLENPSNPPYTFAGVTIANLEVSNGWLYMASATIGQRGLLYMDFRSDSLMAYSFITSPVQDTSDFLRPRTLQTVEKLFDLTASMIFSYKTKATSTDVAFNDPTSGWTTIATAQDLSAISFNNFTQFRTDFDIASGNVNTPAQINELFISYDSKVDSSDYWAGDNDNTTQGTGSPNYLAFVQSKAYLSFPGTLFARAYDATGTAVITLDTITNLSLVSYSTNGGLSWTAGVGPNTVGTRLRFLISSPPGTLAYASIRES